MIVRNEADILCETLDSSPWPIVALDNGSEDGTQEILNKHPNVLDWFVNRGVMDEVRFTQLLHMKAKAYNADWYAINDADEFFPKEIVPFIESVDHKYNTVTVDIHSELNGHTYRVQHGWRRIYRNSPNLFNFSEMAQLHKGRVPIVKAERVTVDSHIPVIHRSVRSYEQGIRKYENYKRIDVDGIQKSYEHIKTMAEALKNNDFSGVSFVK